MASFAVPAGESVVLNCAHVLQDEDNVAVGHLLPIQRVGSSAIPQRGLAVAQVGGRHVQLESVAFAIALRKDCGSPGS